MALTREQRRMLWLSAAEVTPDKLFVLLEAHGSFEGIWEAVGQGRTLGARGKGLQTLNALHSEAALDGLEARLEKTHVRLLFRQDPEYPELLGDIDDPPYVLYAAGDLKTLRCPMVAVVGTRLPSSYGRDLAFDIASGLAEAGVCVVSGLARGIDSAAHEGALKAGGPTLAVLGSGINVPYPPENTAMLRKIAAGGGLVVSEYPLDAEPLPYRFPHRNRVISGLSHGLLFVEGKVKSGGMLTVASALRQGRDVFATPGRIGASGAEGPHAILREGARLATSARDILDDLGLAGLEPDAPKATEAQTFAANADNPVLRALAREPMTVDSLSKQTGKNPSDLMAELSVMEIMGQVKREPGNMFVLEQKA